MKKFVFVLSILGLICGCGGGGGVQSNELVIIVSLVPATPTIIDQGQTLNFTAPVAHSSEGVTWSVTGTGCSGSACGTFTNISAFKATFNAPTSVSPGLTVSVGATSVADTTKSAFSIVVVTPAPSILTTSLPNGTAGTAYSATLQATGGAGMLTWSITSGSLPTWATLNPNTGVITGTPNAAGTSTFTVKVTDSSGGQPGPVSAQQQFSLAINPPLAITTASLPNGLPGVEYSASVVAAGGTLPYTWSITSGSLPGGLSLNPSTGAISGMPAAGGATSFTVTVKDSGTPPQTVNQALSITINPLLAITTASLPNGVVGSAYSATLQSTGGVGTITWSVSSGSLPAVLTISNSGTISGTPTTAGVTNFTVTATDSGTPQQTKSQALSITVNPLLAITTASLPNGVVSSAYSATLQSTGGVGTITWSVSSGNLPPELKLSSSGTISGTPTTAGATNFTVTATDSGTPQQTKSQALSITVNPLLAITTASLPNGVVSSAYSATLQSTGGVGTITWSITSGSLPAVLTISNSGTISGTPTTAGVTNFTVTATDSGTPQQTKSQALSITVNPILSITTTSLPSGTVGTAYSQNIQTSGGTLPIIWSVTSGALPTGLQLQGTASGSGTISGTPTATGTYNFTVTATDSSNPQQNVSQPLSITINNVPLAISTQAIPGAVLNTAYSEVLGASGGTPPYTWSVTLGSLPAGLNLSSSGTFSGSPTATGTSTFTVTVTDSSTPKQSQSESLSMAVNATACGTGNESILSGQYAFSLRGFNATGLLAAVGSFTADGTGKITAGEVDSNGALGVQQANITAAASSYSVGPDNRGCATLVTSFGAFTTRFALGSLSSGTATEGRVVEWETGSSAFIGAGHILQQTASSFSSGLNGNYAFEQSGVDSGNARLGTAGVISASGGSITAGEMDTNDAGTVSNTTGVTGTYTSADSNGRLTMTATWTGQLSPGHVVFYMVSSSQLLFMTTDAPATNGVQAGESGQQSGTFSNSSVSGNMVYYDTGLSGGGSGGEADIGLINANGTGSLTVTSYSDNAGTWVTPNPGTATCTYSVASNGRMTLSGGANCTGVPVFYLTAANTAFFVGENTGVNIGQVEPQTGGPFTTASLAGTFYRGTLEVANQAVNTGVGVVTLDGSGDVSGPDDYTSTTGQQPDELFNGTVTANADGTFSSSTQPGVITGVIISSTESVLIDNVSDTYPTILVVKQ